MSFSSTRESVDGNVSANDSARAQTTPIVALVALFAVCAGVSLYATTLGGVTPSENENALAGPTLDRVHDAVSDGGVLSPVALTRAREVAPDGYRVAVAVTTSGRRWTNGRQPPSEMAAKSIAVDSAQRPVSVAMGDGDVVWGRLRVWVWR
ncbi:DUF7285 family protein [Halobellus sp. GM3]|uniref:DUF7285 family protein n=1 Tax=Halobellus sp. GM3 TaxID=3458410 RepID=UPI00403DF6A9